MVIKVVLIIAALGLLAFSVRGRGGVRMQAGKRVGLLAFVLANVVAVIFPEQVSEVARHLGVGRGTDLVLYALVIAFLFGMLSYYLRFKVVDRRFTELARMLAIREAELVNRERGVLHDGSPEVPTAVSGASAR